MKINLFGSVATSRPVKPWMLCLAMLTVSATFPVKAEDPSADRARQDSEENAWKEAISDNVGEAYIAFGKKYPNSKRVKTIQGTCSVTLMAGYFGEKSGKNHIISLAHVQVGTDFSGIAYPEAAESAGLLIIERDGESVVTKTIETDRKISCKVSYLEAPGGFKYVITIKPHQETDQKDSHASPSQPQSKEESSHSNPRPKP